MNRVKWGILTVLLVLAAVLFFNYLNEDEGYSREVFLFDTACTVTAYGNDAEQAVDAAIERISEIHRLTDAFSENSVIAKINCAKAGEIVEVGDDIAEILSVAVSVSEKSGGAFEISIAPVVKLWNFDGGGKVPDELEIAQAMKRAGNGKIIFDGESKTVVKTDDGAAVDLGGAAKGYAGDVAIAVLSEFDVRGAIVDLGGNISCFGSNPNSEDGVWRIGLQKPFAPTGEYDEDNIIEISGGAVVTSGTYQRYFEKDGEIYHHIIDPETGYPAVQEYSGVTIVTDSSLLGDCLATACFVLGKDEGTHLAEEYGAKILFE